MQTFQRKPTNKGDTMGIELCFFDREELNMEIQKLRPRYNEHGVCWNWDQQKGVMFDSP
jgi:hypothetical protein